MFGEFCVYRKNLFCQEQEGCFKCHVFLETMAKTLGIPIEEVLPRISGVKRVGEGIEYKNKGGKG